MQVMRKIERFLKVYKMPAAKFGRLAAGDPRLVFDMRNGRQFGGPMVRKVESFMEGHKDEICSTRSGDQP